MQVVVQVKAEVADTLHERGSATTESKDLLGTVDGLGFSLEPLHSDTDDPLLRTFFMVDVPDRATAELVTANLRGCKAVQAAYLKPPDEMPR